MLINDLIMELIRTKKELKGVKMGEIVKELKGSKWEKL